jgi:hypothetical protein
MSVLAETHSQPLEAMSDSEMNQVTAAHTQASKRKFAREEEKKEPKRTDANKKVKTGM